MSIWEVGEVSSLFQQGPARLFINSLSPHSSLRKAMPQRYNNQRRITYGENAAQRGDVTCHTTLTRISVSILSHEFWKIQDAH